MAKGQSQLHAPHKVPTWSLRRLVALQPLLDDIDPYNGNIASPTSVRQCVNLAVPQTAECVVSWPACGWSFHVNSKEAWGYAASDIQCPHQQSQRTCSGKHSLCNICLVFLRQVLPTVPPCPTHTDPSTSGTPSDVASCPCVSPQAQALAPCR